MILYDRSNVSGKNFICGSGVYKIIVISDFCNCVMCGFQCLDWDICCLQNC